MKFFRFLWKLSVMAGVFGVGYIVGREHSFEEEELWNEENEENNDGEKSGDSEDKGDSESKDDSDDKDDEAKPCACASCGEKVDVVFNYENAEASKVAVVGDFNAWNKDASPLKREGSSWSVKISLDKGRHEYQFVINDTDWVVDPKAAESVKNKYEGMNSVLVA